MAGVNRLHYPPPFRFNVLGVVIGIGEFTILGYFCEGHLSGVFR